LKWREEEEEQEEEQEQDLFAFNDTAVLERDPERLHQARDSERDRAKERERDSEMIGIGDDAKLYPSGPSTKLCTWEEEDSGGHVLSALTFRQWRRKKSQRLISNGH
jgi:hypothetical protein